MTKKSLKFHIDNDNYFITLDTIIRLIRENPDNIKMNIKILKNIEDNLMFLQRKYKIINLKKKEKMLT